MINKHQGPIVLHREPVTNYDRKEYEKEYVSKTESLCYIAEINPIVNQPHFNKKDHYKNVHI